MAINKKQLTELYDNYASDVFRYAMFRIQDRESAEDITSEAFLRLIDRPDKFAEIENKKAWLIGITRNVLYETYREKVKVKHSEDEIQAFPDDQDLELEAVSEELLEIIKIKLKDLEELTQEIIVLRVWQELPFADIAGIVELKESATKLRYYRGIEKLKKSIDEDEDTTTIKSVGMPLILGAVQIYGDDPVFEASPEFLSKLSNLLNTQVMDQPIKETPKRVKSKTQSTAPTQDIMSTLKQSLAPVMTQEFLIKGFILAALSSLVVGVVSVAAAGSVTNAILRQPRPTILNSTRKIELEVPELVEEDISIDTSDWIRYSNAEYGINFLHPEDYVVKNIDNNDSQIFYIEFEDENGNTSRIAEIQTGNISSQLNYLEQESNSGEFEDIRIDGKNRIFKTFKFGEGAPAEFDAQGNPTCVQGGGFTTNYTLIDDYLVALTTSFSSTDCNPEHEEITTKTSSLEIAIGRELLKGIKLNGYDLYADWGTFKDRILGLKIRYPKNSDISQGEGSKFISPDFTEIQVPETTLKVNGFELMFVQAKPNQSFAIAGYSNAAADTDFGSFKLHGKNVKFKVRNSGDGAPGAGGCNFSGGLSRLYYIEVRPGVFAYFSLFESDSCLESPEELEQRLTFRINDIKHEVLGIFESLTKIKPTQDFESTVVPAPENTDWELYENTEIGIEFLHPKEDKPIKVDEVGGSWVQTGLLTIYTDSARIFPDTYEDQTTVNSSLGEVKINGSLVQLRSTFIEDSRTPTADQNDEESCETVTGFTTHFASIEDFFIRIVTDSSGTSCNGIEVINDNETAGIETALEVLKTLKL